MSVLMGANDYFGLTDPFAEPKAFEPCSGSQLDHQWMVLDDYASLNHSKQDLLSALQPDCTPSAFAFENFTAFLHTCKERAVDSVSENGGIPNVLDRCASLRPIMSKTVPGEDSGVSSESSQELSSPTARLDEFLRHKLADRRRRNRESSSRCYYKRKRRIAAVKEALEMSSRRVTFLSSRKEQLKKENEMLKKKIAALR